ncbi:nucleotidyltransferase domain protein [Candidatus Vecturithrix granuli]|uniref:Nucleotidyltransferase domain protein n=1 Tax=Vecturithrix granuli TaxID=1499967 RepID=A0A081BUM2_VECG1|nr:nucleotidyltransferase domain protein [Candidatus Vecturithrix granuli]
MSQQYTKLKTRWQHEQQTRVERSTKMKHALNARGIPVFKKFGIHKVVLFGSVLTRRSTQTSDIDLLVLSLSSADYWKFRHELEQAIGYPVDIYTQDDEPVFVQKILQRGEIVYEIQP